MSIIEDYKRDGYAVLKNAVGQEVMPGITAESLHDELRETYAKSVDQYLKDVRLLARYASVMNLFLQPNIALHCRLLGVMVPVFQTSPAVHLMAEDLKIPGGYDGIGAHQDWPALQSGLDTVVVWLPLFDVGEDNFPVEVVPGSHLRGLLPAVPGQHISEVDATGMEFKPIPVARGDALLFSVFTVHRTRREGKGFRIAFSMRYENAIEPTFVERGLPFAQSRTIQRELITPDFPTVDQVQAVFA